MKPTITIDSTNDTATVTVPIPETGAHVFVNSLKLGETANMTLNQAEALARKKAKDAFHTAIAKL